MILLFQSWQQDKTSDSVRKANAQLSVITLTYLSIITNMLMISFMMRRGHFSVLSIFVSTSFCLSASIVISRTMFSKTSAVKGLRCCMWFLYMCLCSTCMRFKERGKRLETGWGMRNWIWLRVWNDWKGLWCRTFSIEHSWVQAGAGSTTTGRLVPEGASVKKIFSEQTAGQDSHLVPCLIEWDRRWSLDPSLECELWKSAAMEWAKVSVSAEFFFLLFYFI